MDIILIKDGLKSILSPSEKIHTSLILVAFFVQTRSCTWCQQIVCTYNPNTFAVLVGKCEKNYLPKEEGREGGEKKRAQRAAGPGARTWDLPRARRGSPAARQGGCLDKQAFPCL